MMKFKNWYRSLTVILLILSVLLGTSCITINPPSELTPSVSEPELPPSNQPAFHTEEGAINAVILHLADLTGFVGNDYSFICNQLQDIYDWRAYLTQDIWAVTCSIYVEGLGRQAMGSWQIDGKGNISPSDAEAQKVEYDIRLLQEEGSATSPAPTPAPTATEYQELPSFDYVGITPPPGEAHRLYEVLLRIRWDTNWSDLYEAHEFDCSEMSGMLENYLEGLGFDTYILVAEITGRDWATALDIEIARLIGWMENGKLYHAWLAVRFNDKYMGVESTIPDDSQYYGIYRYQEIYADVKEAERAYPGEFDYWDSPQYNVLKIQLFSPAPVPAPAPVTLTASVEISAGKFFPANLEVRVGTTVTWTNESMVGYRLEGEGGINSPLLDKYDTYPFTFNQVGTFHYHARFRSTAFGGEGEVAITGGQVVVVP